MISQTPFPPCPQCAKVMYELSQKRHEYAQIRFGGLFNLRNYQGFNLFPRLKILHFFSCIWFWIFNQPWCLHWQKDFMLQQRKYLYKNPTHLIFKTLIVRRGVTYCWKCQAVQYIQLKEALPFLDVFDLNNCWFRNIPKRKIIL